MTAGVAPLGWLGIVRLGLVQAAIGAMVMLTTSLLNRVMVVEYALAAAVPAGLVAWHYVVQLSRPLWGHGSDRGRRRTPWIIGGLGVLALGSLTAVDAAVMLAGGSAAGVVLAVLAFTAVGAGVGAAGTSLLALLAARVAPDRRAAAAAITWIMMVAGIAIAAGVAGGLLEPFSPGRLATVASGVALVAFVMAWLAIRGVEGDAAAPASDAPRPDFRTMLTATLGDPDARRFTWFVFVAMFAFAMQDLILEPFAGLVFGMTPGQSTQLSGAQHGGMMLGMILAGLAGNAFGGFAAGGGRRWIAGGCVGSASALAALAAAAVVGPGWPIVATVLLLGIANGVFAVAAVGAMMALAGKADGGSAGIRMGIWGAAQAMAFAAGGLVGAVGVDLMRAATATTGEAFLIVFAIEAALFLLAARLAFGMATAAVAIRREALA